MRVVVALNRNATDRRARAIKRGDFAPKIRAKFERGDEWRRLAR